MGQLFAGATILLVGILIGTFGGFALAAFGVALNEKNRLQAEMSRRIAEATAQRNMTAQPDEMRIQ